ncbi:HNH endonuclease signature motif containing protein [Nocardia farcinica]|uniref:HNH endonuclease signature motif containing protein n=1 Tax=Nocardia farcinica TaxID=37329 RepID=UPI0037B90EB9
MKRSYSEKTIKILFGRASRCAYPTCTEALIFEDRGHLTVVAEIAHIRSGSPDGPRHVVGYVAVNSEENLLLLCGKHHKAVDAHESIYSVEELLDWKAHQLAEGANRELSDDQLAQIVEHVERSLAALVEVKLTVRPVGMIHFGTSWMTIPLPGLATTTVSAPDQERYMGVEVVNEGLVAVTAGVVGIDFDVDADILGYPCYQFPRDDSPLFPSRRLEGKASGAWPAHIPTIAGAIMHMVKEYARVPSRFRAYVLPEAGDRVEGEWMSALLLPIWEPSMTQERLDDMSATAAEVRRHLSRGAGDTQVEVMP